MQAPQAPFRAFETPCTKPDKFRVWGVLLIRPEWGKKAVQVFLEIEGEKKAPQGFFSKVVSGIFSFQFAQQRGPHKRAPQAPGLHAHGIGHAGEDLWID